jgi:hypothetical protein
LQFLRLFSPGWSGKRRGKQIRGLVAGDKISEEKGLVKSKQRCDMQQKVYLFGNRTGHGSADTATGSKLEIS